MMTNAFSFPATPPQRALAFTEPVCQLCGLPALPDEALEPMQGAQVHPRCGQEWTWAHGRAGTLDVQADVPTGTAERARWVAVLRAHMRYSPEGGVRVLAALRLWRLAEVTTMEAARCCNLDILGFRSVCSALDLEQEG